MRARTIATLAGAAVVITAIVAVMASGAIRPAEPAPPASSTPLAQSPSPDEAPDAATAAEAFLADWVDDGRVVRRDQGGDTVSEGQSYGLMAALVADDEPAFDAIWTWTHDELQRPDGLLAWRWQDGAIVDDEPASDADLDAARALVLAGARFDRPDLTAAGTQLAQVIADRMTVQTAVGRILLPGLWAAAADPYAYNPSYASPAAFRVLGDATGDPRWAELEAGSAAVTAIILTQTDLPPDWAQVHGDGTVEAMPGPAGTGGVPVQYGFDAARLPLRFAESCSTTDAALAARLLPTLQRTADLPAQLDLGGGAMGTAQSPLAYAARAAAAGAAGEHDDAHADLRSAATLAAQYPTYYGQAWAALGTAMLTNDTLGGCAVLS